MDDYEVTQRIIGLLTLGASLQQEVDEGSTDTLITRLIVEMFSDTLNALEFRSDDSMDDVLRTVGREISGPLMSMVSAFMRAYYELAREHDAGGPSVSSADVLRQLAVRAELEAGSG